MRDLVLVDVPENGCGFRVSRLGQHLRVVAGVVEIGLLEGKTEPRDVVERGLHRRDRVPEIGAERVAAELDPALRHPREIPSGVALLLPQRLGESPAEGRRSVGEFEKRQGHQLRRQQLVVGEEMEEHPPARLVHEAGAGGERRTRLAAFGKAEPVGTDG